MKKLFSITFLLVALTGIASAHGNNLWEHFSGQLPRREERAKLYKGEDAYVGSAKQNQALLESLHSFRLGGLAPLPGSITEGTSTAGWTDDGSIVRLNTQADNVGIGTINPSQKLQVQGSAYITSNLSVGGGTFDFSNGPATTTITKLSNGNLGFGTNTPASSFSFSGGLMAPGTTTLGTLVLASSTIQLRGIKYTLPAADGTNNQVLSTDGAGGLSFATTIVAPSVDTATSSILVSNGNGTRYWSTEAPAKLHQDIILAAASSTIGIANIPPRKHIELKIYSTGLASAENINLRFNADSGTTYGWEVCDRSYNSGNAVNCSDSSSVGTTFMTLMQTATTSPAAFDIHITNFTTQRKIVNWHGGVTPATIQPPRKEDGDGVWNNTSAQIHEITVNGASSVNLNAGTIIQVWGYD